MSRNIEIIKGEQHKEYCCFHNCNQTRTAVYFMCHGKKRLVINAITQCENKYIMQEESERLESLISKLQSRDGKYYDTNWRNPHTVEELIAYKEENHLTFTEHSGFSVHEEPDGRVMFHGNFNEYSRSFFFVIYDKEMARSLMKRFPELPADKDSWKTPKTSENS